MSMLLHVYDYHTMAKQLASTTDSSLETLSLGHLFSELD